MIDTPSPDYRGAEARQKLEQRFWANVDKRGPEECWPWRAYRDARGYGSIYGEGRSRRATQVSWEIANGRPFPEGLMACHTCDNPPCVNPAHLWAGTMSENIKDAFQKGRLRLEPSRWQARKTHCKYGHPLSGDNLRMFNGKRLCRTCRRRIQQNYERGVREARLSPGAST